LPCREVTQTTGSKPRGTLFGPAVVSFVVRRRTTPDEPDKLLSQRSPHGPRGPSKGLAEAGSPSRFSSRAPELPANRFGGAGGSHRCVGRPKTLVERRPAKEDAFGKVGMLFTESEPELASKTRVFASLSDLLSFTPPIHSRDLRALLQRTAPLFSLRGASP